MVFNVNPGKVKEVVGSALLPINSGLKMVIAACSLSGEYSSKTYETIIKRFGRVREDYRGLYINRNIKLGNIHTTIVSSEVWVAQLVCFNEKEKLDKKALTDCVKKLVDLAKYEKASLHVDELLFKEVPTMKKVLLETAQPLGISVYIYKNATETTK